MSDTLHKLLEAIEQAEQDTASGFDTLANAEWHEILRLCKKLREEMAK